jgi:uncharacterized protein
MILRWDFSKLDKFERTGSGGLKIPAYLSRSGVLNYANPDGSVRKELRHPDVIFAPESLETLKHVAVTEGHQAIVDASNWKSYAVGHVGDDVRREGDKIAATVIVEDASVVQKIESGALKEISLGYTVDLADESGEFEGEAYTHKQLAPQYNHCAIGPANWGRAGEDVALRLDGKTYGKLIEAMADEKPADKSAEDLEKLKGENDALTARVKDLESTRTDDVVSDRVAAGVKVSLELRSKAAKVLGYDKVQGTDREVMVATIAARSKEFKADGLSDDALRSAFEFALTLPAPGLAKAHVAPTIAVEEPRNDCADAFDRMVQRNKNMWKGSK